MNALLPLVIHRERANGVDSRILLLVDWWMRYGIFHVVIPIDGGIRTDAGKQAIFFARGVSRARTLADTPHGRGAALDIHPVHVDGTRVVGLDSKSLEKYREIGDAAKRFGLEWGGDWEGFADLAHVQVPKWKDLPYPLKTLVTA